MTPHPTALRYILLIALGFGVGTYGTLIGAGGGFVLMPVLLLLYPHESPNQLTSISLAVVFFNAISGSAAYARMKRIDYKSGLMFGAAAMLGGVIGVFTTEYVSRHMFNAIFSVFLLVAGTILFLNPKSEEEGHTRVLRKSAYQMTRHFTGVDGISFEYSYNPFLGIGLSFVAGYLAGFFGIGGGIVYVPVMAYLLHFPVHLATATSQFVLALMTLTGTITHIWTGSFHRGAHRTAALGLGVMAGAQLGAYLSSRIKGSWIIRGLALGVIVVGVRIIISTFW
jgi:uncharacterized membrane protein YfcA